MRRERPYKRKLLNFSVKPDMQFRLVSRIGAILAVSLLICSVVYYVFSGREIGSSWYRFHVQVDNFLDMLLPIVIAAFLLGFAIGLGVTLFFPKRIAGPLYRIERELERIGAGDLSVQITLRKGDHLTSLAEKINGMAADLRRRMTVVAEGLEEAQRLFGDDSVGQGRMSELERIHARLKDAIGAFRL